MTETGVGRIVDSKYEILASIGHGGMSYVWLGRDKRLDKMWAIKEFRPDIAGAQGVASRQAIIDEANFIKRLDHPAIPRIVDIIDTGTSIFVVMDFIDGTALNKVLRQQGQPFEQERVIEWGIQLCNVLEYLHCLENPVVYRDMKPSNIMLRSDDTVKLIDFGIAMELLPSGPSDTRLIGTSGYGAPEQIDGKVHKIIPVDTRADIYALGATLYSLVTSHIPRKYVNEEGCSSVDFQMRPIRTWNGQLSEGLEHILEKATQSDPANRYQSASEMRYDLEHYHELTREYRAAQKKKVDGFYRRLIAAGIALLMSILCLGISHVLRNSNYDTLIHEASVADTVEKNEVISLDRKTRKADASEAEELYTRAIEVSPARIETYFDLVDLYKADNLFATSEARRWTFIWQTYGRQLENDPLYGKLSYTVGILYLVYYDYADARSIGKNESFKSVAGQGTVENAILSKHWFEQALEQPDSLSNTERDSAEQYIVIGNFHETVAKANREGDSEAALNAYKAFWHTIEETVVGEGKAKPPIVHSAPIVQLRVCQVAFESVRSSTHLEGFARSGITREQADALLGAVCSITRSLSSFVRDNSNASEAMFNEIIDGEDEAWANIARVFKSQSFSMMLSSRLEEE